MNEITIVITMQPDGQVNISGPLDDRITCYGLLDTAKDIIQEHAAKRQQAAASGIVPVRSVADFRVANAALTGYPPDITIGPKKE